MKKLFSTLFTLLISFSSFGQSASTSWPLTNPGAGGTGLSPVISSNLAASDEILNNMEINQYTGLNSSQRIRIAGNAWPANQTTQIDTVFVQFSVTPQNGFKFNVDSIALNIIQISLNNMKANIYYSTDSTFTTSTIIDYVTKDTSANHYLDRDTFTTVRAGISQVINPGETIYLRIYPWVDNDPAVKTGKYIGLQDVQISGTIESLPLPSSAMWPLSNPGTGGTGLSPVVAGGVKAENEKLVNTEINQYTGLNGSQRVRIIGNAWPANQATQLDTVYIQFQASPKFGGTFNVDSISLAIAGVSITTMKANIYYSTDPNFGTSTQINYSTGDVSGNNYLRTDSLQYVSTSLSVQVNTGESIYLRVYPWVANDPAVRTGKYLAIQDVIISGTAVGVTADPPTVTSTIPTYISTTFATSGGNISTDGGALVTARGVVWNTTGTPTISDSKTEDGTGVGSFTSSVTGLTPGQPYYLRAYATNDAGTAYGDEFPFTTLDSLIVPTLTTKAATNIQVTVAVSGGDIVDWGGAAVTERGVCWNTTGSPTISDNHTVAGSGIGSFNSGLTGLTENTPYYVKAYAKNSVGYGYGNEITFTTLIPAPDTTVVVDKNGGGNYTTVQEAFNAIPMNYTGKWTVFVKKGVYYEKDTLAAGKVNVILIGEDRDSTIITYDDYGDKYGPGNPGTSGTFTITIDANDFVTKNITFQNTYSPQPGVSGTQAVALRTNGDRQEYINCRLLGYQDTYYTWGGSGTGRLYHKNCYIEGTVDFIFGRNIAVFDSCTIRELRQGGTLTAASTDSPSKFGYVFRNCTIVADSLGYDGNPITSFYLGRPWQNSPRTVFVNTNEPASLNPAGWLAWNVTPELYAEYKCYGAGSNSSQRVAWSSQLSDSAVIEYNLSTIFSKNSAVSNHISYDWMPTNAGPEDDFLPIPVELTSFSTDVQGSRVMLFWSTASELNNKGFEIERRSFSENQYNSWIIITFVSGNGTTNEVNRYSYLDENVPSGNYSYRLKQIDFDGTHKYYSSVDVEIDIPKKFELMQNYPNPFNPATIIRYEVPQTSKIILKVYDILGNEVTTLVNEKKEAGRYQVQFDAGKLASGIYFYRISGEKFVQTKKMMLIK